MSTQLVASGAYFEEASNPKVLVQVGLVGSVGSVEMQGFLFTTRGPTAGLILVEWNIRAASPGSTSGYFESMWLWGADHMIE
ncbi:hypothetical protein C8A05DRAFT_38063 [Staphylotrichum tortipilum]|uniref:Uncharacterized protein n=1 Tax=Staphylotrichum tortipilum TaxID=2831512 RepID=A0AAN6RPT8_9PEZI|nr:hypothetical protein C8A05DRAFT_38063 [Staphylotrichum longicolle]